MIVQVIIMNGEGEHCIRDHSRLNEKAKENEGIHQDGHLSSTEHLYVMIYDK